MNTPPTFWRSPRLKPPLPAQEITIPDPPPAPSNNGGSVLYTLLPVALMAVVMIAVALTANMTTMLVFSVPLIVASGIASVVIHFVQKNKSKAQAAEREQKYRALLNDMGATLDGLQREQQRLRLENDPSPEIILDQVQALDRHLWSRRPADDDFLSVRVGVGAVPSIVVVKAPIVRDAIYPDPLVLDAQGLATRYTEVWNVPTCLNLRSAQVAGIAGDRASVLNSTFALVTQLAAAHSPTEVKLAAVFPASEAEYWRWLRWLPHVWNDEHTVRYLAEESGGAVHLLQHIDRLLDMRHRIAADRTPSQKPSFDFELVVILGELEMVETHPTVERLQFEGPELGIYSIFLSSRTKFLPQRCQISVRVMDGKSHLITQGIEASGKQFSADVLPAGYVEAFAVAMAPIRLRQAASRDIPTMVTLLDQLGVQTVEELDIPTRWQGSARTSRSLAAPIGMTNGREPLLLDLHEKADGPNGLVAGMVGAGKSELLQTLVATLAVNFHPHKLAFVLIDYKGGGMADPFVDLPHTLGVITNLQQESLARRALASLMVEAERRQQIFKTAGVTHIDDYQKRYYEGKLDADAVPLPYLVVIVDEFAEMKTEQPEVAREFVRIARLGRALGFRLILAMQKPAGIVDGQIEANTRFRLCLRVAQTEDSHAMLKRNDAAFLTGTGRCILQVGAGEVYKEFQVAWGGALYDPLKSSSGDPLEITSIALDGSRRALSSTTVPLAVEEQSQLKAVIHHLLAISNALAIPRLDNLWLAPLPANLSLEKVRPPQGWDGTGWQPAATWLTPVIGLVDRPRERCQTPLALPLGKEGHLAIYSAPGYGKTTAVQTLITSLALTHSPAEVNFYLLDFGGRLLKLFEGLPHTGAVITTDEMERLERLIIFLRRTLDERRDLLGQAGVSNLADYRELTGSQIPALVVAVDNYANFTDMVSENELITNTILRVVQDGGSLGVHLIVTANNSTTIRFAVSSNIMLAIALHLVEPGESASIVGRTEDLQPLVLPGRGLLRGTPVLECQIATPIDGATDAVRSQALRALLGQMAQAWHGFVPMSIHVMPEIVPLAMLFDLDGKTPFSMYATPLTTNNLALQQLPPPIGVRGDDLTRLGIDLRAGQHFLIAGPGRSGKSTLLRTIAATLSMTFSPEDCELYLLDSKRHALAPLHRLPHVKGYAVEATDALALLHTLETRLTALVHTTTDANAVEAKPRIVVLVDDLWDAYDEALPEAGKDLIAKLIRIGRTYPLHFILAGKSSDLTSKAWQEPLKTLKDMAGWFMLGTVDDSLCTVRMPYQEKTRILPVGEGYFIQRGNPQRIKVATAEIPIGLQVQ